MRRPWLIVGLAALAPLTAWGAVAFTYFFLHPTLALFTAVATVAALSLEGFFWACAAVLGWSFLAKRRQMLARLRDRFLAKHKH